MNDLDESCLSSSSNSEAKMLDVEESASAMLSASLSDCFRATPTDTFTFFPDRSSVGGAIRPAGKETQRVSCFIKETKTGLPLNTRKTQQKYHLLPLEWNRIRISHIFIPCIS